MLPYDAADMDSYEEYYDDVMIPRELYKVHYKATIEKRNEWIIDNTDLMIMHVTREEGNSAKCLKKAQELGREIINII